LLEVSWAEDAEMIPRKNIETLDFIRSAGSAGRSVTTWRALMASEAQGQ
jgi:hypothetical protein